MLAQRKRHGMVLIHKAYKPPLRNKAENHVTLRNLVVYGKCMPINYSCLSRLGSVSGVQEPLTGYQAITEHFHTQHIGTISPMCIERHLKPLPLIVKRLFGSWVKFFRSGVFFQPMRQLLVLGRAVFSLFNK